MHSSAKRLHEHEVGGDETNTEYEASEFGGFNQYFRNKQIKLDTQLKEANPNESQIFKNCHIYVNGRTEPSHTVLKKLIVSNGGSICSFLGGKTYATHIVAEYLTKRKNDQFVNYKVVKPSWVVDCVEQNRVLDWTKYRALDPAQPGLRPEETQREIIIAEREKVDCLAPDFISSYYARSRLHFLSTRKAELRSRCKKLAGQLPKSERPSPRVIMHIDFDSFFVSVALKTRPDLRDRPICVSWGGISADIASCNYKAREFGVKNGMWVGHAKELCPELQCLSYDFNEYTRCSDVLYEELTALLPDYLAPISVDEALADITSLVKDSDPNKVVEQLRQKIKFRTGINASVGIGPNIFLAKMALRLAKPDGQLYLTKEQASEKLAACSVKDMPGIGYHITAKLQDLGISTHAHIKRVSEATLKQQLGNAMGAKLVNYGNCDDSDDIAQFDQEPKSAGVELCWGVRLLNEAEVTQFVTNLTKELWSRVNDLYPETLTIKLYRRKADASFVPAKYMGCGPCDVTSRTRKVVGFDLDRLESLVAQTVQSLGCPPMDLRGIGLNLRLMETTTPTGPPPVALFAKQAEHPSRSTSPSKLKFQLPASRRRKGVTLSQFLHRPGRDNVDMDVFDNLPSQIKKEIMAHGDEFHINVPLTSPSRAVSELAPRIEAYEPIGLHGTTDYVELRALVRNWVNSSESPHYEDVCEFRDFVDAVFDTDWDWTKAINLVRWLEQCTAQRPKDWQYLAKIMREWTDQKHVPIN